MELPIFKIRCSQIGQIMGGAFGKPTDKQLARLDELQKRANGEGKPLTDNMKEELADLIQKRDAKPELQAGAKTYLDNWIKEQIYRRTKEVSSKYTEKGILCEQQAIDLVARRMNYGLISKNDVRLEDEYMTGECDLNLPSMVEDIKNSWDVFTFPLFANELPDKDYYYQLQGYMHLYGKQRGAVNYCLIDAPDELINNEAFRISRKAGFDEVEMELYDEVKAKMTYADIPDQLKHKRFEFDRNDEVIRVIQERVVMCRQYIAERSYTNTIIANKKQFAQ